MATVLVLDDDPAMVFVLSEFLARAGHKMLRATNFEDALQMLDAHSPELAVLDYHLGNKTTGLDFLRQARTRPAGARLSAILVSAHPPTRLVHEISGVPRLMVLLKPVAAAALAAAAQEMLGLPPLPTATPAPQPKPAS